MYELSCPSCGSSTQYDFNDYLLMCPFCPCTFWVDPESGQKEIYADHYIIPHSSNPVQVKADVLEWLRRMHHRPGNTEMEYRVTTLKGQSIPYWIVSMEVHTYWRGLVKRESKTRLEMVPGADWLAESGNFRRNYRWAISARHNICESWGLTRLHHPKEKLKVNWDGFPLDSTFSRGQLRTTENTKNVYDAREAFDAKFANGMPIIGIQVVEEEAMRRARMHVEQYHIELARLNVDLLLDIRTETEVAGVQLVHLPFWFAKYYYTPKSALRHLIKPKEQNVLLAGYNNSILDGELALKRRDKVWVNSIVCGLGTVLFLLLGAIWHAAFLIVALFTAIIGAISAYMAFTKLAAAENAEDGEPLKATGAHAA